MYEKVNENDFAYRFGDNGPKYLIKGPNVDIGCRGIKTWARFSKSLPYNV